MTTERDEYVFAQAFHKALEEAINAIRQDVLRKAAAEFETRVRAIWGTTIDLSDYYPTDSELRATIKLEKGGRS